MTDTPPDPEVRTCDKCSQTDSDPHHVQYVAFNHPVTGEPTDLSVTKHIDCCAEDGCPICTTDVAQAQQAGVPIPQFVQERPTASLQALFEEHSIETPEFSFPDPTTEETPA